MPLTSKQKQQLKAQAHALKPVVLIGNQGLTAAVNAEIDQALTHHELIKVRLTGEDKLLRKQLAEQITNAHQAEFVQMIGKILVLYRKRKSE